MFVYGGQVGESVGRKIADGGSVWLECGNVRHQIVVKVWCSLVVMLRLMNCAFGKSMHWGLRKACCVGVEEISFTNVNDIWANKYLSHAFVQNLTGVWSHSRRRPSRCRVFFAMLESMCRNQPRMSSDCHGFSRNWRPGEPPKPTLRIRMGGAWVVRRLRSTTCVSQNSCSSWLCTWTSIFYFMDGNGPRDRSPCTTVED